MSRPKRERTVGTERISVPAELQQQDWRPQTLEAWQEEFTYRAAIIEYEGGYTRPQAQQMAGRIVGPWNPPTRSTP